MERVFGLDLLRCVAVLMVVVAHTRFFLRPYLPWTQSFSVFGYLGVELFFVLSGFLIGGIILKTFGDAPRFRTIWSFWVRRWFRTLPNYYLFLLLNLLLIGFDFSKGPAPYFVFLQNLFWKCPLFFNESWSLAVEEWFYLLFPLVLLAASRIRPSRGFAVMVSLGLLFALSTGARIAAVAAGSPSWDAGIRKVVIYRFDALMLGVLAAMLKAKWPATWVRVKSWMGSVGAVAFALTLVTYYACDRNSSFFARTFFFNLTSLSVFLFLPFLDAWRTLGGTVANAVRSISLWSYSLYLCHLPIHHLLTAAFGDPEAKGATMSFAPAAALCLAFVVLSILVSALTYRFFEKPAMNLREKFS